jgi:20S proteasome alpha/beta subunit
MLISIFFCFQEPEDLFETISQCLLSAVDRDAFSGWGGIVHVMYVFYDFIELSHSIQYLTTTEISEPRKELFLED